MHAARVVLISTYELGHQPFGLASPAAWLREAGAAVTCFDLAVESLSEEPVAAADVVAFYVPMHTATRLAIRLIDRVKRLNPAAHLCFFGLYASINEAYLRTLGVDTVLGGEFEHGLVALIHRVTSEQMQVEQRESPVSLAKQQFVVPDRRSLPDLHRYAHLTLADGASRTVGYTESTRGCKHLCRHCPIPPVYGGTFRVVQRGVVLEDIARQVTAGAQHVTFGDPDFFNGPGHALRIVEEMHRRFPDLTYDVTIKVEHILAHADLLPTLRATGCLFVTSAVESFDDGILARFAKGHTRDDIARAVFLLREAGVALNPTFVTFTPWTSLRGYLDMLQAILDLDLVANVTPIQYAIRLLIPAQSHLLHLDEVRALVGAYDDAALCYPWRHPDECVDRLFERVLAVVTEAQADDASRLDIFRRVWALARAAYDDHVADRFERLALARAAAAAPVPHLSEPWYC